MKAVTNTLSVNVTSQKKKKKKQKNNEKQGKKNTQKIPQNKNKHHDPDVQNLSSL